MVGYGHHPVAAATPVTDGLYRLNFAGTEAADFDYPEPRGPYSWLLAIRSACPLHRQPIARFRV
jgi:hypothetical protein